MATTNAKRTKPILQSVDEALEGDKRWALFLFVLAFLLKLTYLIQISGSIQFKVPILDSRYYDELAQAVAKGGLARKEAFFMGPLYPYLLGFVYSIFGRNLMLVGIIQMLGSSLTVVLTYLIGSKLFRPAVGFLAALLLVFYGATTFYEGWLLMMWLGTLLNMLVIYVLIKDGVSWKRFALAGFLLGLSALARANILVFAPVVLAWILFGTHGARLRSATVFLGAMLVAIAPATVHNYMASRDFVLVTANAGVNFYIGNNPEARGVFYGPKGVDFMSDTTTRRYVEKLLGRDLKPSELSDYWLRRSWEFIKRDPAAELRLLARKTALFFNGFEVPQIESYDLSRAKYGILKVLFVNFWVICSLGVLGIIATARRWKKYFLLHWFIFTYSASIILFFVTARYRIQIVPVLVMFAAYSLLEVLPGALARRRAVPLLGLAVLLFFTRPGLFAYDKDQMLWREYIHEGRRLGKAGRTSKALEVLDKAVRLRPRDPESYIHRAIIYKGAGKLFQAIDDYTKALEIYPDLPSVHYDLAQTLRGARMYEAAIEEYLIAIEQDSLMIEAYNNLGLTYLDTGERDKAIKCFRNAVRINPDHLKAYNNLGACLAEKGAFDEAASILQEAVRRDPSYANAHKNLANVYLEKKDLERAREEMKKYIELRPDDDYARKVLERISAAMTADTTRR
jgi:tetratricopeptide (TPR) repeat protein